ncbi:MAG: cation:proton antiporter [Steroidobacteraceae bacterium]
MTEEFSLIINITVVLALAGLGGLLATFLRQPPVAGYLAAGVVIGPFTGGFSGNVETIAALAEVGVIFLMFALGVSFSVKELARVGRVALWSTLAQMVLTIAGGALMFSCFFIFLKDDVAESLFIGCALAASSSVVMLKTLIDRGEAAAAHGRLVLSMAIVQDLLIVLLIVLLPLFAPNSALVGGDLQSLLLTVTITVAKVVAFIGIGLFVGMRVLPVVMGYVTRLYSPELFILAATVIALGSAVLSASLGLSAALGAFLAGLMLSESEFDHRVLSEVVPLRDLFTTLFFVSVGMLIDLPFVFAHWKTVLLFAGAALLLKVLATLIGLLPFRLTPKTAAFTSLCMMPIGELNFVLAQSGLSNGSLSVDSYRLILAAALVTIVLMPALLRAAPWCGRRMAYMPLLRHCFDPDAHVIGHASGVEAHAVVVGYGRVGHSIAAGLRAAGMPLVVIDTRLPRVREAMSDGVEAIYGSAASATVLQAALIENARLVVLALVDHESTLAVIRQIRALNTTVTITARAEQADDEVSLKQAGASLVIVPELAGADTLLNDTLDMLGMPR